MSIDQVETAILELPSDERRRLLLWMDEHRQELFGSRSDDIPGALKEEVLKRRQDYFEQPERFIRVGSDSDPGRFFEGIRREVQTRVSSSRQS